MSYPRYSPNTHKRLGSYRHSFNGELLKVGEDQYRPEMGYAIIALDNSTAAELMEDGWNVRLAERETRFLGTTTTEDVVYVSVSVPRFFDRDKFSQLRHMQYLSDDYRSVVEVKVDPWDLVTNDGVKVIRRLFLEEIYHPDDKKEPEKDEYDLYVEECRAKTMPAMSRTSFYNRKARQEREDSRSLMDGIRERRQEREFANRRNNRKTYWNVGESVVVSGVEYEVGNVKEEGSMISLRLDRKCAESVYLRVPK